MEFYLICNILAVRYRWIYIKHKLLQQSIYSSEYILVKMASRYIASQWRCELWSELTYLEWKGYFSWNNRTNTIGSRGTLSFVPLKHRSLSTGSLVCWLKFLRYLKHEQNWYLVNYSKNVSYRWSSWAPIWGTSTCFKLITPLCRFKKLNLTTDNKNPSSSWGMIWIKFEEILIT